MNYMQIEKSKSGLFLMELIVATLVLAVTSINMHKDISFGKDVKR